MAPPPELVQQVSKCMVKPDADSAVAAAAKTVQLSTWDLEMLSVSYIERGLLFSAHSSPLPPIEHITDQLKSSLSAALLHFYPLAGRLVTHHARGSGLHVSIDCVDPQGAEFIHASAAGITVAQVLAPCQDVPSFVSSFFPYNHAICYDGHSIPLLAVQVTELADGIFLACCFNHVVGDGTSFWHFLNSWAEIMRSDRDGLEISRPPVHDRWFIDGEVVPIKLPFSDPSEFIHRSVPPPLPERIFHFSSSSIAKLKAKANEEPEHDDGCVISSLQALSALTWRSIARARRSPKEQSTIYWITAQNRARLQPPLSPDYFGNSLNVIIVRTTVGELLTRSLGWAAGLLNREVRSHGDEAIRAWARMPYDKQRDHFRRVFDEKPIAMGSSPRFDMYGCDFGWGKAVAMRSRPGSKFDGRVSSYPGREGGGSVDMEICLIPEHMAALELDEEFMNSVSLGEE